MHAHVRKFLAGRKRKDKSKGVLDVLLSTVLPRLARRERGTCVGKIFGDTR